VLTFHGFPVANLMMDSGCNTTVLPLAEGDIQMLPKYFPPPMCNWSISVADFAGRISMPVLAIYRDSGALMECKFPEVGFYISPSVLALLCAALMWKPSSTWVSSQQDPTHELAAKLKSVNIAFGGRRKHGHLGQDLLDDALYASFQYGPVLAIVEKNFDWSKVEETVVSLNAKRAGLIDEFDREAAAGEKFADLLGEDHDVDPGDEDSEFEFCD